MRLARISLSRVPLHASGGGTVSWGTNQNLEYPFRETMVRAALLSGGVGADFFGGGPGTDTATDFEAGQGDRMTGIP